MRIKHGKIWYVFVFLELSKMSDLDAISVSVVLPGIQPSAVDLHKQGTCTQSWCSWVGYFQSTFSRFAFLTRVCPEWSWCCSKESDYYPAWDHWLQFPGWQIFFPLKSCSSSPCPLDVHIGLLAILLGSLCSNHLRCSKPTSFWLPSPTSRCHHLSYDPWLNLLIHSLSHQLSANYYAQALLQMWVAVVNMTQPWFFFKKHMGCTVQWRQLISPVSVLSLLPVSSCFQTHNLPLHGS